MHHQVEISRSKACLRSSRRYVHMVLLLIRESHSRIRRSMQMLAEASVFSRHTTWYNKSSLLSERKLNLISARSKFRASRINHKSTNHAVMSCTVQACYDLDVHRKFPQRKRLYLLNWTPLSCCCCFLQASKNIFVIL